VIAVPTSKEYRDLAVETRILASQTKDEHEREVLLRVSAQWELLVEYKGARETGTSKRSKSGPH